MVVVAMVVGGGHRSGHSRGGGHSGHERGYGRNNGWGGEYYGDEYCREGIISGIFGLNDCEGWY